MCLYNLKKIISFHIIERNIFTNVFLIIVSLIINIVNDYAISTNGGILKLLYLIFYLNNVFLMILLIILLDNLK